MAKKKRNSNLCSEMVIISYIFSHMIDHIFSHLLVQSPLSLPSLYALANRVLSALTAVTFLDFKNNTRTLTLSLHITET